MIDIVLCHMKKTAKESKLPRDILKIINLEIEQEIQEEMNNLESSLDKMTLADMEKEVVSIRSKMGRIFMQKVVEAKEKISKKKLQTS